MCLQLCVMRTQDPSAKALVFSQFVGTLEWLKVKLQEQGFGYRTISGSMTLKQRSKVRSCPANCCQANLSVAAQHCRHLHSSSCHAEFASQYWELVLPHVQ